jgi:hypothetical protein
MQSPQDRALEAAMLSVFKEKRPTICFLYLGNDTTLFSDCIHSFNKLSDLSKHFRRKHLSIAKKGGPVECKVCIMPLDSVMHLQRHAIEIHGTVS